MLLKFILGAYDNSLPALLFLLPTLKHLSFALLPFRFRCILLRLSWPQTIYFKLKTYFH